MKSFIVDSFTNKPFSGNPAGVCLVEKNIDESRMLNIAKEFNLSETAFIKQKEKNVYEIRYFSPKIEVPLCGHATLASAKVLFEYSNLETVYFMTKKNVSLHASKLDNEIIMEFPVYELEPITIPDATLKALGIEAIKNSSYNKEQEIIVLEIESIELLRKLQPDFIALVNSIKKINGIVVTAKSNDDEYDFHYRYFWPWSGTNEDPVTGGVQPFLTKYWAKKLNKTKLKAFQSSARTGYMSLELVENKVLIKGQAVIMFEGNLLTSAL